jgi:hypothetical protein
VKLVRKVIVQTNSVNPYLTTADVLEILRDSGKPLCEWGGAIDGAPMLSARAGGQKQPSIFITAGAHSDETAGVHAALNLLKLLDTEHEVHILPLRDPYGFAGVAHCLSFAAGQPVKFSDHAETLQYLKEHADLIWHENEMYVFKLGEIGFVWNPLSEGLDSFWALFNQMMKLSKENLQVLKPLLGKSMMLINPNVESEGSNEMQRCWHSFLSPLGEWLHLNRFFGRADAPPEVAAVDRLMQTVRPGLTCDLHEGNGSGFWMPLHKPDPDEKREVVIRMTEAYFGHIKSHGYPITTYEEWKATDSTPSSDPSWMLPEPRLEGLFWTKASLKGEGPNLIEYADRFGVAYGTEAPMLKPLAMRVDGITHGIQAAIKVWEETLPEDN